MEKGKPYATTSGKTSKTISSDTNISNFFTKNDGVRYPLSITKKYSLDNEHLHPTQKPVALLEYLIKTYTNENDIVLDFTAGSGSTAIACINTNRQCVLIEKEEKYCKIAAERVEDSFAKNFYFL